MKDEMIIVDYIMMQIEKKLGLVHGTVIDQCYIPSIVSIFNDVLPGIGEVDYINNENSLEHLWENEKMVFDRQTIVNLVDLRLTIMKNRYNDWKSDLY